MFDWRSMAAKGWLVCVCMVLTGSVTFGALCGFEDLSLEAESYWNGADESGGFASGGVWLSNNYNSDYGSWDGFAYSNITDTTAEGYAAQYNAIAGSGQGGSANYAVSYIGYAGPPTVVLDTPRQLEGLYVTNSNYAYYSMLNGDMFSKKFGGETGDDEDWFMLTVVGRNAAGDQTGQVEFYLADYRSADSAEDYIVDEWEWLDLGLLGVVSSLEFYMNSSDVGEWGMNTPGYFAVDTLVPEPATVLVLGLGGLIVSRRRKAM